VALHPIRAGLFFVLFRRHRHGRLTGFMLNADRDLLGVDRCPQGLFEIVVVFPTLVRSPAIGLYGHLGFPRGLGFHSMGSPFGHCVSITPAECDFGARIC